MLLLEKTAEISEESCYLFFTPYSIYYWDKLNQAGQIKRQLKGKKQG